jgi:NADH oxidase (H2O-forming)
MNMEIKNNIFYVGVLNATLRVFDITMKTEYGTSYNSYLIKDAKNTLIDTVPEDFFEEYISNIEKIVDIKDISYLIINHAEPDHSGSVNKLLLMNPKIQIYCTMAASRNINNICNKEMNANVVKDDDILAIGDTILRFKPAPFLHWPDTMFTYDEKEKIVFTGDFLGAHFAEPRILDEYIHNSDAYIESVKHYYNSLLTPFKPFVLKGLEILSSLNYSCAAPSHGPVVECKLEAIKQIYTSSSLSVKGNKVSIIYASAYGYTKKLAVAAKEYIEKNSSLLVSLMDVNDFSLEYIKEQIESSKALLIGSPTINRDAVKPIWDVLSTLDVFTNKSVPVGVFGSYGWSGEAVPMLITRLSSLGLSVIDAGIKVAFNPTDEDLKLMEEYTKNVIESVK